ncbi:MAG: tetratricopeptide repeat protein [Lamprobacter sp.]|uniref:tetratricopeptide repeat protein n=1 Tax=Lamprobacter sp. TaxID=3100796 RepID=UPI002B25A921|nr:tetratricopeptide repeat protein [Lamprobacter sp.]MEA3640165.1 tetratricopeptide repeat protein [Lamprobacter sp.]
MQTPARRCLSAQCHAPRPPGAALALLRRRRYADARTHLEAALEANPDATEVHYPLARAYQGLGLEDKAKAQMKQFLLRSRGCFS